MGEHAGVRQITSGYEFLGNGHARTPKIYWDGETADSTSAGAAATLRCVKNLCVQRPAFGLNAPAVGAQFAERIGTAASVRLALKRQTAVCESVRIKSSDAPFCDLF